MLRAGIVALCLLAAASTKLPRAHDIETIAADQGRTWTALLAAVADRGMVPGTADSASGLLVTVPVEMSVDSLELLTRRRGCVFCKWRRGRYRVDAGLTKRSDGSCRLALRATVEGYNVSNDPLWGGWRPFESKGLLEAQLLAAIKARLQ